MKMLYSIFGFLLIASAVQAADLTLTITEVTGAAGALDKTCAYWCRCNNANTVCRCKNYQPIPDATAAEIAGNAALDKHCINSDDGNGGDTHTDYRTFDVPVNAGQGTVIACVTWTSLSTTGGESAKGLAAATACHSF